MSFVPERDVIHLTLAGSHAHGTAGPHSDVDVRGIVVVPLRTRVALGARFEQREGLLDALLGETLAAETRTRIAAHPSARAGLDGKIEGAVYDVAKLLQLASAANPSALELLFTEPDAWLLTHPLHARLVAARSRFLTRRAGSTYVGYALAQLRRIETHRAWLLRPPAHAPTRAAFGLPEESVLSADDRGRIEAAVRDALARYGVDELPMPSDTRHALEERLGRLRADWLATEGDGDAGEALVRVAQRGLGLPPALTEALLAERRYRAAQKTWASYEQWKRERNPARAELEAKHGYDTKHAMHLVRLLETGLELVREGVLRVRRPNVDELVAIRRGALPFEALKERAERGAAELKASLPSSPLPEDVDAEAVDALLEELIRAHGV